MVHCLPKRSTVVMGVLQPEGIYEIIPWYYLLVARHLKPATFLALWQEGNKSIWLHRDVREHVTRATVCPKSLSSCYQHSNPRRQQQVEGIKLSIHHSSGEWQDSHVCTRCCWNPRLPIGVRTEGLTHICTWAVTAELPSLDNVPWSKWTRTKPTNGTGEKAALCSPPVIKE